MGKAPGRGGLADFPSQLGKPPQGSFDRSHEVGRPVEHDTPRWTGRIRHPGAARDDGGNTHRTCLRQDAAASRTVQICLIWQQHQIGAGKQVHVFRWFEQAFQQDKVGSRHAEEPAVGLLDAGVRFGADRAAVNGHAHLAAQPIHHRRQQGIAFLRPGAAGEHKVRHPRARALPNRWRHDGQRNRRDGDANQRTVEVSQLLGVGEQVQPVAEMCDQAAEDVFHGPGGRIRDIHLPRRASQHDRETADGIRRQGIGQTMQICRRRAVKQYEVPLGASQCRESGHQLLPSGVRSGEVSAHGAPGNPQALRGQRRQRSGQMRGGRIEHTAQGARLSAGLIPGTERRQAAQRTQVAGRRKLPVGENHRLYVASNRCLGNRLRIRQVMAADMAQTRICDDQADGKRHVNLSAIVRFVSVDQRRQHSSAGRRYCPACFRRRSRDMYSLRTSTLCNCQPPARPTGAGMPVKSVSC